MSRMVSVLVADSQRLLAESLRRALSREADLEVLPADPQTGLEAVEAVLRAEPDVAVLDYWMEGMKGHAAARLILHRAPQQRIILLAWFHGPVEVDETRRAGALALLSKDLDVADLAKAIRRAREDLLLIDLQEEHLSDLTADSPDPPPPMGPQAAPEAERGARPGDEVWQRMVTLTPREIEILGYLSASGRPQDVAKQLSLTTGTVRLHIEHILAKTGARSHVEAVVMARDVGLI